MKIFFFIIFTVSIFSQEIFYDSNFKYKARLLLKQENKILYLYSNPFEESKIRLKIKNEFKPKDNFLNKWVNIKFKLTSNCINECTIENIMSITPDKDQTSKETFINKIKQESI